MKTNLITPADFKALARPSSLHIDDDEVNKFIKECEDVFIIPAIGYATYKRLLEINLSEDDRTLLYGGEWTATDETGSETLQLCNGLQSALSYFVFAKMVNADGTILSRAGAMRHNEQYGYHIDTRAKQYDENMDVAEKYLSTCLAFLRSKDETVKKIRGTRCRVHAIGR